MSFVILLSVWEAASRWLGLNSMVLPAPSAIFDQLVRGFASGLYPVHFGVTVSQALLGFLVALAAGIGVGSFIARSPLLERTVQPFLVAFQSMPKIALAPSGIARRSRHRRRRGRCWS